MSMRPDLPATLVALARELRGRSWEAAKRLVVSKTGSVGSRERFDDDVADAVFLRIQRNAQVGRYASEAEVMSLGRRAHRLTGDGTITLYRAAPRGAGIRPGDFATDSAHEAGHYTHGGHVLHVLVVPRTDVIAVAGSLGGGAEYVYLPPGFVAPEPQLYYSSLVEFFAAANAAPAATEMTSPAADEPDQDDLSPAP